VRQLDATATRNIATTVRIVDKRANLLEAGNMLSQAAIDKYSFTRDAYLQFRRNQVFDGNPPEEPEVDEPVPQTAPAPPYTR